MRAARTPEPAPIAKLSQHRRDGEIEAWICERLKLRDLFDGVTSTVMRRDRLKLVLLERGLIDSNAGRMGGKAVSWRELVKQLYGEDIA